MSNDSLKSDLEKIFRKVFKTKPNESVESAELGSFQNWDSLQHFNLLMSIEHELQIDFSEEDAMGLTNFRDIFETVKRLKAISK